MWGLHALAYATQQLRFAGLLACFLLLVPAVQRRVFRERTASFQFVRFFPIVVGLVGFMAFYFFPIQTEVYGDTRTILRHWTDNTTLPPLTLLSDFNIFRTDAALTQILVRTTAHVFNLSIENAFRLVSAISGGLCLALWTSFISVAFGRTRWANLLLIAALGAGANQIFFGHVETYAFAFLCCMVLLISAYLAIEGRISLWLVAIAFVVALKAHSIAICFAPALLFISTCRLVPRFRSHPPGWRWTLGVIVAPTLLIAAVMYLFYFKSFASPYTGTRTGTAQTFLPVLASGGFRDYSLFSLAHLLDLANVLLMVGTPTLLVILGLLVFHRRAIDWGRPQVIFASLALIFPLLFLLAVNPLLSMPRDWDLYALLGAPLLIFLAAIVGTLDERMEADPRTLAGSALAFSVFSVAFFALNATPSMLRPRLEQVGEHIFMTYHTNASYLILTAHGMDPDTTASLARREETIRRLEPKILGEDAEYTHLVATLASLYRERGQRKEAVYWSERAAALAPSDSNLALTSADYLLWANDIDRASRRIADILERHPNNFDALVLAAIAGARREDYAAALGYLERAHAITPSDPDVPIWEANLKAKLGRKAVTGSKAEAL